MGQKTEHTFALSRVRTHRADQILSELSGSLVPVVQSAEAWEREHATAGCRSGSGRRCFLAEPEMRPIFLIVTNVLSQEPLQMLLVDGNHVVEQIAAAALDPALRDTVLPRTCERSSQWTYPQGSNGCGNIDPILRVPIKLQKPRSGVEREGLPQLLHDPAARRMLGDVDVQNTAALMADHEKTVQHAERDRGNGEEIDGRDDFSVIAQKGQPTLGRLGISRGAAHPPGNRSLGKIEAEHQKFTVYPGCSPRGVFGDHTQDQVANPLREPLSAARLPHPGDQLPIESKTGPVPTDHRFRSDQDKRLFATGPEATNTKPKQFVNHSKFRTRVSPLQHNELMPENEILDDEVAAAAKHAGEGTEPEQNHREHRREFIADQQALRLVSY